MTIGVLGGGISGLSLAYFLQDHVEVEVLEAAPEPGGLLSSATVNGYTFDLHGGHILFSRDREVLELEKRLLRPNLVECRRNTKIWYRDRRVKYPFENGLGELPPGDRLACLQGVVEAHLRQAQGGPPPRNFHEWLLHTFGEGICRRYLWPYNEKIWKHPLDGMSTHWAGARLPLPPLEDILKSAMGIPTEGYTHQLNFYYPRRGGFQALARAVARRLRARVTTGFRIRSIRPRGGGWDVSDGRETRHYTRIASTLPIPTLLQALGDIPPGVRRAARGLRHNSLYAVLLGVDKPGLDDISWCYFPGPELFHKISFMNNYSPTMAPRGKSAVMAEITTPPGSPLWGKPDSWVARRVIEDLHGKWFHRRDVELAMVHRTPHAYVVYDLQSQRNIQTVLGYIHRRSIATTGRFAEWEYINSDMCIRRAWELAKRMARGRGLTGQ
ncbi:MAG: FAD-dependent oxidoreductase [Euryarchaeota archaeon]|nr:FAD-dependent oxidoreductase [Euryarchaeota archaeon]